MANTQSQGPKLVNMKIQLGNKEEAHSLDDFKKFNGDLQKAIFSLKAQLLEAKKGQSPAQVKQLQEDLEQKTCINYELNQLENTKLELETQTLTIEKKEMGDALKDNKNPQSSTNQSALDILQGKNERLKTDLWKSKQKVKAVNEMMANKELEFSNCLALERAEIQRLAIENKKMAEALKNTKNPVSSTNQEALDMLQGKNERLKTDLWKAKQKVKAMNEANVDPKVEISNSLVLESAETQRLTVENKKVAEALKNTKNPVSSTNQEALDMLQGKNERLKTDLWKAKQKVKAVNEMMTNKELEFSNRMVLERAEIKDMGDALKDNKNPQSWMDLIKQKVNAVNDMMAKKELEFSNCLALERAEIQRLAIENKKMAEALKNTRNPGSSTNQEALYILQGKNERLKTDLWKAKQKVKAMNEANVDPTVEFSNSLVLEGAETQRLTVENKKMAEALTNTRNTVSSTNQQPRYIQQGNTGRLKADLWKANRKLKDTIDQTDEALEIERRRYQALETSQSCTLAKQEQQEQEHKDFIAVLKETFEDQLKRDHLQWQQEKDSFEVQLANQKEENRNLSDAVTQAEHLVKLQNMTCQKENISILEATQSVQQTVEDEEEHLEDEEEHLEDEKEERQIQAQFEDLQIPLSNRQQRRKWYQRLFSCCRGQH
ncbi:golgin subfamily A member 6-like protein 22 [Cyclopterus lumpus]|uniref:golgin subfamily A member 6-like protein 22 n=1 Tax=Cyclopterus lumpus TaxID=8103 RepID=UPI0014875164|nr:golgin subfamily A member 6-like protein 22 [Cyclopterus lumpus]